MANDPQWGNRGNGGPPDLDEIWRNFTLQLRGFFGGKGTANTPPPSPGDTSAYKRIAIVVGVVFAIWMATGFYQVDATERGIVLRFGKYVSTTESGPRWHIPYPIESKEIVNVSGIRSVEIGYREDKKNKKLDEALMLTDDENIIDIQFAVQYILKSPQDYLFNNRSPDDAVRQVAETAIREIVGKSKMDFVLNVGREDVAKAAGELMQRILDRYRTGILISAVTMQNAQPPDLVQAAFDEANKAEQDRERKINEGQAYYNDIVPKVKGTASRLVLESEGYRQRVISNAQGEASRFKQVLAEYHKAPQVTRDRLYLDMQQQVLSNTSKVLIDQKAGGNLLYIPLDKLMQMTGSPTVAPEYTPPPNVREPEPTDNSARSRDAFRGRDREER